MSAVLALSAAICAIEPQPGVHAQAPSDGPPSSSIVLLGTGTPVPDPDASGPATAITVGSDVFLVDAGAGITRRMRAAKLPDTGVTAFFVTHLHSDHTLGYPDLILTSWVMGRRTPLQVYGPHGLRRMTNHLLAAWQEDIDVRINGLEREVKTGYGVDVHEIRPGVAYDRSGVRVTAFSVPHGSWKEAYGYRFDTPGRSIVISGDTRASDALVRAARGCDVLIHEVYIEKRVKPEDRPGGEFWPQYMHEFHTSEIELGALAARIQPRLLILSHVIRMGGADQELIDGIRQGGFTGRVVVGKDLERY
jgi:ribonuclease BN (tRNA processing enzyme)